MNKKVLIIVIIAVAAISIPTAVYTISPLFISNTIDEPLPKTTSPTTNNINQKAASQEYQKFISMNQQDIMNTAKQMNQNQKNMIMIGAAQVNNTVNENIAPAVESNNLQTNKSSTGFIIRTGSFVGAGDGFHNAEGIVMLIPLKDRSNILRLESFKSTNGPDVHIYLSTDKTISDSIDLGKLKANNGNQNYDIPIGTNLPKYKIVLIWCKPFSVLFGSAELMT